jgi:hypothetical protein
MIVFDLICAEDHRFEGWFASSEAFERQRLSGLVACPVCASGAVEKLPSARIRRGAQPGAQEQAPAVPPAAKPAPAASGGPAMTLASFIDHVLLNTEDVGLRFPEEARKIHREEAPRRAIRGTASREDAEALAEEGIPVLQLPIPPASDWH